MDKHSWVHLACHEIQDLKDSTKSALILHNNRLKLSTLMSRSLLHARLAFLSVCQTATGNETLPEKAVHLAAEMLNASYKSVVGMMWSIGNKDTSLIANMFYETICWQVSNREEVRPAYALHEATKHLRKKVGKVNFVKWILFVHFAMWWGYIVNSLLAVWYVILILVLIAYVLALTAQIRYHINLHCDWNDSSPAEQGMSID